MEKNEPTRLPIQGEPVVNNLVQEAVWNRLLERTQKKGDRLLILSQNTRAGTAWLQEWKPPIDVNHVIVVTKKSSLGQINTWEMPRIYTLGFFDQGGLRAFQLWRYLKNRDLLTDPYRAALAKEVSA